MTILGAFLLNTIFNFILGLLVAYALGPEEFGRFALALAVGVIAQTLIFDWIRLSALRFLSAGAHASRPDITPTLDLAFAVLAIAVMATAAALFLSGLDLPPSRLLFSVALTISIANGLFDYRSALLRAQFQDRPYARLLLIKNVLGLTLTVGAAFVAGSALAALVGACVSMAGSVALASGALRSGRRKLVGGQRSVALDCAQYALPIVVANVLYAAISLMNRYLIAEWHGLADTGYFSLANDVAGRLVAAIGTALDVLLFQLAVRTDENQGRVAAQEQVARNLAVVFAILAPAVTGFWLILPSVEALLAPAQFRGHFSAYVTLLLPGIFFHGMAIYAVNAVFQIQKKTRAIFIAAFVGCAVNAALVVVLGGDRQPGMIAVAQSLAYAAAFFCLAILSFAAGGKRPAMRDMALTCVAVAGMTLVLLPMREWTPGFVTLAAQTAVGGSLMISIIMAADIGGLRPVFVRSARQILSRIF